MLSIPAAVAQNVEVKVIHADGICLIILLCGVSFFSLSSYCSFLTRMFENRFTIDFGARINPGEYLECMLENIFPIWL